MNTPKKGNNSISFWRIIFTLLIIMLHCGFTQGGYIAVEFFFLVSGFLLAKGYYGDKHTSLKQYIKKRIQRLYPMYFVTAMVFLVFFSILDFASRDFSVRLFFIDLIEKTATNWKSVLMLQLFGSGPIDINAPAWYVAALFWVALLYFILMKLLPKKAFVVFTAVTSGAVLICCFIFIGHLDLWEEKTLFISQGVFRAYAEIGLGILIYVIKEKLSEKQINSKIAFIVELIGYVAILVATAFTRHTRLDYLLLLIMAVCVFLSFSEHRGAFFRNKIVTTISGYTYGVYMNHSFFVVLLLIFGIPFNNAPQIVNLLWIVLCATVCGVVFESLIRLIMKKLNKANDRSVYCGIFMIVVSIIWIYTLKDISGSLLSYVIIAIVSVVMCVSSRKRIDKPSVKIVVCVLSLLLSGLVALAHYYVFDNYIGALTYAAIITMLITGFFVFYYIFRFGYVVLRNYTFTVKREYRISGLIVFISACLIYIILNILILVLCKYPCDYFYDSLWQFGEIQSGDYTNHHPIYHTWILGLFFNLGYVTGIGPGNALFIYTVLQIIVVGLIVGYYMKTLYEMRVPIVLMVLCFAFLIFNPISLKYAPFVDKDQLYVYMALLFLLALTRIILGIGKVNKRDYIYMIIGALGFGLFRGNGFVILLATMIVAVIMKSEVRKKLMIAFASLAVVIFVLNTPVRNAVGVKPTEFSESLSIPIQQVSRVVYDGYELDDEDKDMIFALVEEDVIKEQYEPYISDNMKGRIQFFGRDEYFKEHIADYVKLYIRTGLKYPGEYVKAWVDETHGYFAPGYGNTSLDFSAYDPTNSVWADIAYEIENDRKAIVPGLADFLNDYAKLFEDNPILYQFLEIGGLVYLMLYMFVIKIWKRNKTVFIETAGLVTVLTLIMASPLATSIRYTYLIFLTVYLSIATTFYKKNEEIA